MKERGELDRTKIVKKKALWVPACHVIVALELTNDRSNSAGWKARSCLLKGDGTGSTARRQVTTGRNGFHCPSSSDDGQERIPLPVVK